MIDGAVNFRDMGGLRTDDGRVLRPKLLYRTGALDRVSDLGLTQLGELDIVLFFDLRSDVERSARPARLPASTRLHFREHARQTGSLYLEIEHAADGAQIVHQRMCALYRALPYIHRDAYRMLLGALLSGTLPLAFGCAAGKDRTGVAALLLLTALGVAPSEIEADYLATQKHFDTLVAMFFTGPRAATAPADRSTWEPILHAELAYLDAAREAIRERNGSIEAYLADEMGIGPEQVQALRARLMS